MSCGRRGGRGGRGSHPEPRHGGRGNQQRRLPTSPPSSLAARTSVPAPSPHALLPLLLLIRVFLSLSLPYPLSHSCTTTFLPLFQSSISSTFSPQILRVPASPFPRLFCSSHTPFACFIRYLQLFTDFTRCCCRVICFQALKLVNLFNMFL